MTEIGRRGFLGLLGASVAATAAALELDPERALWVPGEKSFFLPSKEVHLATPDEVQRFLDPEKMGERYRLDVASPGGDAGHTALFFNSGWQLLRAQRHHATAGASEVELSPQGLMVLEAELGERMTSFARVGAEKQHGISHEAAGHGDHKSLVHLANRTQLNHRYNASLERQRNARRHRGY